MIRNDDFVLQPKEIWETQMRRSRFLQAGILSFCLIVGYVVLGCGDEGEVVTIEVEQLCALALEEMNSRDCRDTAEARVDDLKDCVMACGVDDTSCIDECLGDQDEGLGECSGNLQFLVAGPCGDCYPNCFLDFVGEESEESGCLLDPVKSGEQCLNELYTCVNDDC
jgi:hypothetical protein